ncbi:MAG: hypothetical protein ACREM8_09405, partial [Vulcanimicrobiaceae bacterium]
MHGKTFAASAGTLKGLRERAVYLVLREGKTQAGAAALAGVHRQAANRWIGRHRDAGAAGRQDGRRSCTPRYVVCANVLRYDPIKAGENIFGLCLLVESSVQPIISVSNLTKTYA